MRNEKRHWTQVLIKELPSKNLKTFFCCESDQALHRLPREVVDSPSSEILKNCLDAALGSWLWTALLEQGFGKGDLQSCIPTSASL